MFELNLSHRAAVSTLGDAQLIDEILATSKLEAQVQARRLSAVAELWFHRKQQADPEADEFIIDTTQAMAAEIAAAIGVTSSRAFGLIRVAEALRVRLPKVGAVFARGEIDMAMVFALVYRTELVDDPDVMANVDSSLATRAPGWTKYSRARIAEYIDSWVGRFDPAGVRERPEPADNRYLDVRPSGQGLAGIWGNLHVDDAIVFDERIEDLIATVCPEDPRAKSALRADAVRALADRQDRMTCTCGSDTCGGERAEPNRDVVIHIIADSSTVDGTGEAPGFVGGFGPIAADTVRNLAGPARRRKLVVPKGPAPEPGYRPSVALAEFVRVRDLYCRFPGCSVPAALCDIDHTIPFGQGGLTHPSNLKCECRIHHLLKTFYVGPGGWSETQMPDGTVNWVAPTGHVYTTKPGGQLYFPVLGQSTGTLAPAPRIASSHPKRTEMMPKRRRTRAEDVARRHADERHRNAERLALERRLLFESMTSDDRPPPF